MILCTSLLLYSFYYYIFRSNQTIQVFFPILFPCLPWKYSYLERMPLRHHSYFLLRHPFLGLPERCPFFKTLHYGTLIPLSCIIHLRYSLIDSLITTAHSFSSKELNPFSLEHACLSGLVLA